MTNWIEFFQGTNLAIFLVIITGIFVQESHTDGDDVVRVSIDLFVSCDQNPRGIGGLKKKKRL